ncbi:MAG: riboflavin synthase [Candidatus Nanopelagicales bacterium]|nr:riboflavin synthase [Candidatus Nanopelagicales bacterium]MDP4715775.1 riboflavin synthase [Candidatus Nanopelagicales bacterium]MDP4906184.1 riboflavin synthase [Candidatus Nanopelagicales bacterium]MDP4974999.1 riboflavin synthase [Candidatus Nanopelagicales bacterium]
MFTGIVEESGVVTEVVRLPDDAMRLVVSGPVVAEGTRHGDSISVNGVCLTVTEVGESTFAADVMRETLVRSSLRDVAPGSRVNLERAVTLSTRLGGHIVQGHVDGTGTIVSRVSTEHWDVVRVAIPVHLAPYLVDKGSVAVDGVSLTVSCLDIANEWFEVSLIPTTLSFTTLGDRQAGDVVNLEVDILAKYVERLLRAGEAPTA